MVFSLLFLFFSALFSPPSVFAAETLCDGILVKEGSLRLNDNERVLVCGSSKGGEGWERVPLPQAELHLRSIVQNLGYLQPRFERTRTELFLWLGPRTEIQKFTVQGGEGALDPGKKRKVVGEPLVPDKLNEIEAWANRSARSQGYACPVFELEAHAWDGSVGLKANLGSQKRIGEIVYENLEGLNLDVMDRYQPFSEGDVYDIRKTQIMTARLLADGLFQSAYFLTHCQDERVRLELNTSIGLPRILRFGIGASTEELPFFDLTFRNARLDDKASSITGTLHASPRRQSFTLSSELYWIYGWPRVFLGPRASLSREAEASFETNTAKAGVDLGRNFDLWNTRFLARWGPTYNYVRTIRGVGPEDAGYPTFDGSLSFMNHDYESSLREQFEGWSGSFFYRGQNQGLGSKVDVNRYDFRFKHLWNIGGYSPPLFVLGSRWDTAFVDASALNQSDARTLLPIEDRIFAGGDQDLRGFPRQSINNGGLGYLSFVYLGFELRVIEELPYRLQPFLLWDFGRVGNARYKLDPPLLTSEGAGIRWASPFGTLRGSAARGRIFGADVSTASYPQQWVYFFSFGQEF